MIKLEAISKSFAHRAVLKNVCLEVGTAEALCVCGANAAGKTTLLKIAAGLVEADNGSKEIKGDAGVILDKNMVYGHLTVIENLKFFARLYGIKDNGETIERLLEQTALSKWKNHRREVLSAGTAKRLAIARALLHKPSVLLADEPFAGLDREAAEKLIEVIAEFKRSGGAVLMTSHNVGYAVRCCEKMAVLNNQKIVFEQRLCDMDKDKFLADYMSYAGGEN